jgi:hypothetical protein
MRKPSILSAILLLGSVRGWLPTARRDRLSITSRRTSAASASCFRQRCPSYRFLTAWRGSSLSLRRVFQDRYLADKIYGFSPGVGMLMVSTGEVRPEPRAYASDFDHDFETATPYYYAVDLQTCSSRAEYTATQHAGFYRVTFLLRPALT